MMGEYEKIPILRDSHKQALTHYQTDASYHVSKEFPQTVNLSAFDAMKALGKAAGTSKPKCDASLQNGNIKSQAEPSVVTTQTAQVVPDVQSSDIGNASSPGTQYGEYPKPATCGLFQTDLSNLSTKFSSTSSDVHVFTEAAGHPHYATTIINAAKGTIAACGIGEASKTFDDVNGVPKVDGDGDWLAYSEGPVDMSRFPDLPSNFFESN